MSNQKTKEIKANELFRKEILYYKVEVNKVAIPSYHESNKNGGSPLLVADKQGA